MGPSRYKLQRDGVQCNLGNTLTAGANQGEGIKKEN